MTTLADYGVSPAAFSMSAPLEQLNPRCIMIKECLTWEEVEDILKQNKKTHPDDRIWIGYNHEKGCHQAGREAD